MLSKYEIVYLPVAERDLSEILEYIRMDNPSAALSLPDTIDEHILRLADFPELGKILQDHCLQKLGYRILVINSYLVFYGVYFTGKENTSFFFRLLTKCRSLVFPEISAAKFGYLSRRLAIS